MGKKSDVSKQVWKFQEGLAYLAIRESYPFPENVYWNYERVPGSRKKKCTPASMSIDPDIVIGKDINNPEMLVFVTHASMERGSEKKFWRTVAEVIEEKAICTHPRVLSILYSGNVKTNIMVAYECLFDGVFHLDNEDLGIEVSSDLMLMATEYGSKSPLECLSMLVDYIRSNPKKWSYYHEKVTEMLHCGFGEKHTALVSISENWHTRIPRAHNTAFRIGLYKLVSLPEAIREQVFGGNSVLGPLPRHAVIEGWFSQIATTRSKEKYRLIDDDIKSLLREFDIDVIRYLISQAEELDSLIQYIDNLRNITYRAACNDWICDNYAMLSTNQGMNQAFNTVFEDPSTYLLDRIPLEKCPTTHWLFEQIMTILRVETGRSDGYGYSALGMETGHEYEIGGLGGVVVSPYIKRTKKMPELIIQDVANVFSGHFRRLGKAGVMNLLKESETALCHSLLTYTIGTYRLYNPIDWLVTKSLRENGIAFEWPTTHASFLSADVEGITTSTGNMIKVQEGQYWIKCQSSFDGKTDKRKELCGRVGAMKLAYSSTELEKTQFFLVLDGYFNQEDISLLDKAGWDGIFYYNEMDALISSIRKT